MFSDQMETRHRYTGTEVHRALGELYDQIINDLTDLKQRTTQLEDSNMTFSNVLDALEEKLTSILADRTYERTDLYDESHIVHLSLAGDYRSLIMQWMQRVARKMIRTKGRTRLEYELGRQVGDFSEYLFRGAEPDANRLLSSLGSIEPELYALAVSMCDRATILRGKVADIGVHHEWDFRTELSGVVDEERQEAWLTCDPTDPIDFIVAPGYVVQGVVYSKQLVATGMASGARRDRVSGG
jgi:hypothetical protein